MGVQRPVLGIDLGGTAIKVGVVSPAGSIIARASRPTQRHLGVEGVIAHMTAAAREVVAGARLSMSDLDGAGIGCPGLCDVPAGMVVEAVNLGWRDVPVAALLQAELGTTVLVDNDANCAALGEQWCGAAAGSRDMLMFTVGTGVGGGLILGGQIYHGARGWAGEFGHMPAVADGPRCNCGQSGCLETVSSATAIAAAARRLVESGAAPALAARAEAAGGRIDARLVITAAAEGDPQARAILSEAGRYLGYAAAGLVSALNPELVVVGGGVSVAGEMLLAPMREQVRAKAMPGPGAVVRLVAASLGNDAGLIGAASLVWRQG